MTYPQEDIKQDIIERLAQGESLRAICRDDDMPNRSTIMRWLDDDNDFAAKYARAKDIGFDERAEKLSDDIDAEDDVQRAKLKFEYGRWYLSKLAPKKYGDKIEVDNKSSDGSMKPTIIEFGYSGLKADESND